MESSPESPSKVLSPELPVSILSSELPVALLSPEPVRIKFSKSSPKVHVTDVRMVSVPSSKSSVTVSLVLSTT